MPVRGRPECLPKALNCLGFLTSSHCPPSATYPWKGLSLSPTVICTRSQSSSELQARETPRREFCAGPQRRGGERVRTEPAGAHPLVDSRYRHLAARERCGRLSPSATRRSLPMRAPQPWPCSSETDWRLWRGHLDHVQMPNRAALKREADAEIARIVRCRYGGREPKRPAAVPPQRLPLTDAR